jgi:putative ABC transport system permease protein
LTTVERQIDDGAVGLFLELRHGARALRRRPGIPILAVLTLGVGMALVTVQYTALHALLFQPLPFDPAGAMLSLRWSEPPLGARAGRPRYHELRELQRMQRSFEVVTGFGFDRIGHSVRLADGRWIQREGLAVLPDFLRHMGARLRMGRSLEAADHHPGAGRVIVISDQLWKDLGSDPAVLGTTLSFDQQSWTIVGALQPGFGVDGEAFWAPAIEEPAGNRDDRGPLVVLAVRRTGVTLAQANQDLGRLAHGDLAIPADVFERLGHLEAVPARTDLLDARTVELYWMMLLTVVLVLFCSCANVSNLLLARASGRRHELALRSSLGASRLELVRQMLSEALPIGLAAAALGVALAAFVVPMAQAQAELMPLPRWIHAELDWAVAAAVVCVSLAATLTSALIPALRASRLDLAEALKEDMRTSSGLHATRTSSILSVVQLGLSASVLFIAFGAALTVENRAQRALRVDPKAYVSTNLFFPRDEFRPEQIQSILTSLDRKLRELPGGVKGGLSSRRGLSQGAEAQVETEPSASAGQRAFQAQVGLSYFDALGVSPVEGRGFTEGDGPGAARVAIVDTRFVERFWAGQAAVGRTFELVRRNGPGVALLVVGVVPSLHMGGAADQVPDRPGFFTPLAQSEGRSVFPFVTGSREGLERTLLAVIRSIDPEGHPRRTFTFQDDLDRRQSGLRIFSQLFALFGFAALALSVAGMYGLTSLGVRQRVREIGTRMALGATAGAILALFIRRSARQVAIGLVLGIALGVPLLSLVEQKVGPMGMAAPAYALVAAVLAATALVATVVPSLRAARLSPVAALRQG